MPVASPYVPAHQIRQRRKLYRLPDRNSADDGDKSNLIAVVSGIAIWKPVQLAPLTDLMGGYVWARYWHFLAMTLLVILSVVHVFMVFAVDPYSLKSMITGGYDEANSPEARNARPFYHLLPNRFRTKTSSKPPSKAPPIAGESA